MIAPFLFWFAAESSGSGGAALAVSLTAPTVAVAASAPTLTVERSSSNSQVYADGGTRIVQPSANVVTVVKS